MLVAALFPRKESTTVTLSRYHGATEFDEVSGNVLKRELIWTFLLFPGGSEVKASACNEGDLGSIPGSGRPLEKEMATHSSILAWKIPWREEPGGLQSMGWQRVGHD